MYRPNFCAECGTRVERKSWRVWTSRRFCPVCARRFQRKQLISTTIIVVIVFTLGLFAGRLRRPGPTPLIIERGQPTGVPAPATSKPASAEATAPHNTEPVYGPDGTANERPTDPDETISICGARTQKGTPCQRRVRGTGRCWQHKGMPAIIPLERRVLKDPS